MVLTTCSNFDTEYWEVGNELESPSAFPAGGSAPRGVGGEKWKLKNSESSQKQLPKLLVGDEANSRGKKTAKFSWRYGL
ncbi:UNVERIFIED_CONTAM: hypothetical protein HHA_451840 [Hammondia hammondi]|eukprot:XP_008884824.1 hypothetical protein HHA_451840 [Hammondia hammondi]